jgi:hypothetical protein
MSTDHRARVALADIGISALLPRDLRNALIAAGDWPQHERIARIDQLTDEAARRGKVRERSDCSRAAEWQRRRDALAAAAVRAGHERAAAA